MADVTVNMDLTTDDGVASATINGALLDVAPQSPTGSGNYDSFVRINSNDAVEGGFNTDARPIDGATNDANNSPTFTRSVLLSDMAVVTIAGVDYYEFKLDANEPNSETGAISLDTLQVYTGPVPADPDDDVTTLAELQALNKVYDLDTATTDNTVELNAGKNTPSGSGQGDLFVYIPVDNFIGVPLDSNVYLYSTFGDPNPNNGGFEEWGVLKAETPPPPPPTPHASVSLLKDTVCPDDLDHSVAGQNLLVDSEVTWTYTVTNTGELDLTNIVVTDDNGTVDDGNPINGDETADDIHPIAVEVEFNGVMYNVGDTNHDHFLTADNPDTDGNEAESWLYTAGGTAVHGTYVNNASVTTTAIDDNDPNTPTVDDPNPFASDSSTYTGVNVADDSITIVKEVSVDGGLTWEDANSPTGPFLLDGHADPQYRFTITNNSDVSLDINLVDAKLGIDETYTVAGGGGFVLVDQIGGDAITDDWAAGQNTNTADVSATYTDACENEAKPSASDEANYYGAEPKIAIDKYIVCADDPTETFGKGDDDAVPKLLSGDVNYVIEVSNAGNVGVSNIVVTDPALSGTLYLAGDLNHDGANVSEDWSADGDGNNNGVLDVGETWTYTAAGAWAADEHENTAGATGSFTDSAGNVANAENTASLNVSDTVSYFGLDPSLTVEKKTNGVENAVVFKGQAVTWTYDVTNDGNVALSGITVKDNNGTPLNLADDFWAAYVSGDNANGVLDVGETWHFTAAGIAGSTNYTNTATAKSAVVTDDCGDSVTPSDTDTSGYTVLTPSLVLTQGYWGSHSTAWDGIANNNDKNTKVAEVNPLTTGVLLGDLNHDGITNNGECTFFVGIKAAQAIESSSTTGDARIIMLQQAIAAQLNIYMNQTAANGGTAGVGGAEPNDVITDAVKWLKTYAGQDDSNILDTEFTNSKNNGISLSDGNKVLTNSAAWNTFYDQTSDTIGFPTQVSATGEGLKNALMWWNQGELQTSSDGSTVGWYNDASTNHDNTHDMFWLTLHEVDTNSALLGIQHLTGIS